MDHPGIGSRLRAARERLEWSRETLAYHSGVSWSAISQIESGRRRDVRLSSLSSLGKALGVGVDYLVGTAPGAPALLDHQAVLYGSDAEFVEATVPFLANGLARSEALMVVSTSRNIGLVRDALGSGASTVDFVESSEWYETPHATLAAYRQVIQERLTSGAAWLRVVGEPIWTPDSAPDGRLWIRYESMINLMFACSPATILCPYDTRRLDPAILAAALHTHPKIARGAAPVDSQTYRRPEEFLVTIDEQS